MAMQLDPLPEEVQVTIFMRGHRKFSVHPSTFEEAVDIALIAEFNFKVAHFGTHAQSRGSFERAELMVISYAEEEKRSFRL